jgi:hypothetical protein
MTKTLGFDPLVFLGIKGLKNKEKTEASQKLLSKIYQYILIYLVEELDVSSIKNMNIREVFLVARKRIPNFNEKVKKYLENFKREFNNNLNSL